MVGKRKASTMLPRKTKIDLLKIIVPTKTEDGGGTKQDKQVNINQGQGQGQETTSPMPDADAFSTYSDDDTRMLTLLGLEPAPAANPNKGEQEDWRQLSGFTGVGLGRRKWRWKNGTTLVGRATS